MSDLSKGRIAKTTSQDLEKRRQLDKAQKLATELFNTLAVFDVRNELTQDAYNLAQSIRLEKEKYRA